MDLTEPSTYINPNCMVCFDHVGGLRSPVRSKVHCTICTIQQIEEKSRLMSFEPSTYYRLCIHDSFDIRAGSTVVDVFSFGTQQLRTKGHEQLIASHSQPTSNAVRQNQRCSNWWFGPQNFETFPTSVARNTATKTCYSAAPCQDALTNSMPVSLGRTPGLTLGFQLVSSGFWLCLASGSQRGQQIHKPSRRAWLVDCKNIRTLLFTVSKSIIICLFVYPAICTIINSKKHVRSTLTSTNL